MNIILSLGIKRLLKMKKAHSLALGYLRGHMVTECIRALSSANLVDSLLKDETFNAETLSKERSLDENVLKAICDYLYSVRILDKAGKGFRFSRKGKLVLEDARGPFDFASAYSPAFQNLEALLKREKKYGLDVKRIDSIVAKASAETEEWIPYPITKELIRKYRLKNILDLGCGNANFLIKLCEESQDLAGYGIDISPDVIESAKKNLELSSAKARVDLGCGDIFELGDFAKTSGRKIDVIIAMFVLHEFVGPGKSRILDLLSQLRSHFRNSYLIICELCKKTPDQLRAQSTLIAEHHLFHALSNQSLLTYDEWKAIFTQSPYKIIEELRFELAGQGYFILK